MGREAVMLENDCDMSGRNLIAVGDLFFFRYLIADPVVPFSTFST